MSSLADQSDVEAMLGRPLTTSESARAEGVLAKLSSAFRREAGRPLMGTEGRSTLTVKVNAQRAYLPEPITDIVSVTLADGAHSTAIADYEVEGNSIILRGYHSAQYVTVVYDYNSPIPEEARLTIADAARKVLEVDPAARAGYSQRNETAGPYSSGGTFAAWATGGESMLGPDAKQVARSFRPKHPRVWVQ